jgi:hypothetical protein
MRIKPVLFFFGLFCCSEEKGGGSGGAGSSAAVENADTAEDADTGEDSPEPEEIGEWKPIEPMFPQEGAELTDIALSFKWRHEMKMDRSLREEILPPRTFQLQVDDDESFSDPEIDVEQTGLKSPYPAARAEVSRWTQMSYMSPDLLSPGDYHWRVRYGEEPWSEAVSFHVNDDHTHASRVREISAESPLFSFDMFFNSGNEGLLSRLPELHARFPASVRDLVVFAIQNETVGMHPGMDDGFDGSFADLLQPYADADLPIVIKTGGPDKDFQQFMDLAELEHIFQTQPNVIGTVQGETFWDYIDGEDFAEIYNEQVAWYRRSFLLSAKYGRVVIFGNGNDEYFAWDHFLGAENDRRTWMQPEDIQALSATLIPTAKNNIPFNYYNAEGIIMGSWLAGMVDNWGVWSEGWAWGSIGYDALFGEQLKGAAGNPDFSTMPYNLWLQMKLAGLSEGATVFHFGGESSVVEWGEYDPETGYFVLDEDEDEVLEQSTAFWDMEGTEHPSLAQYVFPFLEAVVNRQLIPNKAEVLSAVKVAVAAPDVEAEKGTGMDYGVYAPLFIHTLGLDGYRSFASVEEEEPDIDYYEMVPNTCRRELLHDNGRYYMPVILPYPIESLSDDTVVLSVADLADETALQEMLDGAYPAFSSGSAWVSRVGSRVYINHSLENTDEAQDFSIDLDGWGTLSGTIQPHSYMLVRVEADEVWVMANGDTKGPYTDSRSTAFTLSLAMEPTVAVVRGEVTSGFADGLSSVVMSHATGAGEVTFSRM